MRKARGIIIINTTPGNGNDNAFQGIRKRK